MKKILAIYIGFIIGVVVMFTGLSLFSQILIQTKGSQNLLYDTSYEYIIKKEFIRGFIHSIDFQERSIVLLHKDLYDNKTMHKTKMFWNEKTRFPIFNVSSNNANVQQSDETMLHNIKETDLVSVHYTVNNGELLAVTINLMVI